MGSDHIVDALALHRLQALSGRLHDIEGSFEVVSDGGEVDLAGGFCYPAPSHSPEAVASFPCPEDFLDPTPDPVDRLVPVFEFLERLLFVAAPHAGGDNARDTTLGADGITEVAAPIASIEPCRGHGETRSLSANTSPGLSGKASGPALPSFMLAEVTATSSTNAVSASAPTCALKP